MLTKVYKLFKIGNKKDSVFQLQVEANAKISLFSKALGITSSWISFACKNSFLKSDFWSGCTKFKSEKFINIFKINKKDYIKILKKTKIKETKSLFYAWILYLSTILKIDIKFPVVKALSINSQSFFDKSKIWIE